MKRIRERAQYVNIKDKKAKSNIYLLNTLSGLIIKEYYRCQK